MFRSDCLQRFVFENTGVRGELVQLNAAWRAVCRCHEYPVPVRDQLGQLLAAALLLSATIKFHGSLILQAQGEGPLNMLLAQVTNRRTLRGLALWGGPVTPGTLQEMFGAGRLTMTVDPTHEGERYQGIVSLEGTNLAAVLGTYFERSEQIATQLWLAADQDTAAGLLIQKLPGTHSDSDAWNRVHHLAATVTDRELLGLEPVEVLRRLFCEEDVRVFEPEPVSFHCTCSRERVETAVRAMGRDEAVDILGEQAEIAASCEFCNRRYILDAVDVERLFAASTTPYVPPTRH